MHAENDLWKLHALSLCFFFIIYGHFQSKMYQWARETQESFQKIILSPETFFYKLKLFKNWENSNKWRSIVTESSRRIKLQ